MQDIGRGDSDEPEQQDIGRGDSDEPEQPATGEEGGGEDHGRILDIDEEELLSQPIEELMECCHEMGLSTEPGSKEELAARDEPVSGNKAWLRRRLHAAIVREVEDLFLDSDDED